MGKAEAAKSCKVKHKNLPLLTAASAEVRENENITMINNATWTMNEDVCYCTVEHKCLHTALSRKMQEPL